MSDTKDSNSLEEKIKILRERKEQLIERLNVVGEDTQKSAESLDNDTSTTIASVRKDVESITTYFTDKSSKVAASLSRIQKDIKISLSSVSGQLRLYAWSVRILWTLFCGILFYFCYILFPLSSPAIIILFVMGEAINELYLKSKRTIINNDTDQIVSKITTLSLGIKESTNDAPTLSTDFSLVQRVASSIKAGIKQVSTTVGTLSPTIKKLTESEDLFARQKRLVESIQYTLRRYQFKENYVLTFKLQTYTSVSENEDIWTNELLKVVSDSMGLNEKITRLIFYDSMNRTADVGALWIQLRKNEDISDSQNIITRVDGGDESTTEHSVANLIEQLAHILIDNRLVTIQKEVNAVDILSKLLLDLPDYSLDLARARADAFFVELLS